MQTMQRLDGSILEELFTAKQVNNGGAQRRRELLEQHGYRFKSLKEVPASKYQPHQGSKEIARRVRQALVITAKQTAEV